MGENILYNREILHCRRQWRQGRSPQICTISYSTAVWCKGLSELSCAILESFNILCNLWSEIIHLIKVASTLTSSGPINVKKSGYVKWDARAASQIILKSLDCLEILENGYNWKEMMFSAPKWACQACQISLGIHLHVKFEKTEKKFY